jgi:hypothetical protein
MPFESPFDWMEPKRNPAHAKTLPAKRAAMYRTELVERAALLHRLGRSKAGARARLAANLSWDFEGTRAGADLDAMVDEVIEREFGGGAAGRPATAKKGAKT